MRYTVADVVFARMSWRPGHCSGGELMLSPKATAAMLVSRERAYRSSPSRSSSRISSRPAPRGCGVRINRFPLSPPFHQTSDREKCYRGKVASRGSFDVDGQQSLLPRPEVHRCGDVAGHKRLDQHGVRSVVEENRRYISHE